MCTIQRQFLRNLLKRVPAARRPRARGIHSSFCIRARVGEQISLSSVQVSAALASFPQAPAPSEGRTPTSQTCQHPGALQRLNTSEKTATGYISEMPLVRPQPRQQRNNHVDASRCTARQQEHRRLASAKGWWPTARGEPKPCKAKSYRGAEAEAQTTALFEQDTQSRTQIQRQELRQGCGSYHHIVFNCRVDF